MGAKVAEVIGAGAGNDGVPDNGFVGSVGAGLGAGPLRRHVDEKLLSVPCEERGQIGVQ